MARRAYGAAVLADMQHRCLEPTRPIARRDEPSTDGRAATSTSIGASVCVDDDARRRVVAAPRRRRPRRRRAGTPSTCPPAPIPSDGAALDLCALYGRAGEAAWLAAGRAVQLVEWARTHRFCGRCGTPTEPAPGERAMRCPACGLLGVPAPRAGDDHARHPRRRRARPGGAARPRRAVAGPDVLLPRRLRRARRVARGRGRPRGQGGGRPHRRRRRATGAASRGRSRTA